MAGKIKELIDRVFEVRARGNPILTHTVRAKLILKGIQPDLYTSFSEDDPLVLRKLGAIAEQMGITAVAPLASSSFIAYSRFPDVADAVREIREKLATHDAKVVIFFASSKYSAPALGREMQAAFPQSCVFGCSTAGELVSGQMLKGSLVAIALDSSFVEQAEVEALEEPADKECVGRALSTLAGRFGAAPRDLQHDKYIGLVFCDGLSKAEESLIEAVGDLTDLLFVGGSAGDDLKFKGATVFANGEAFQNAAILAILKPVGAFEILKTQSFRVLDLELTPTRVDKTGREVLEFGGQPAARAYANAVGSKLEDAPVRFVTNPLGLMVGSEPFVRSPQQIVGDNLAFYCRVHAGVPLRLLESTDMVTDTRELLERKSQESGPIRALLHFNCIHRTLELEREGSVDRYAQLFKAIPTIGFNTYGEAYLGHVNQTATMVLLR